MMRSLVGVLLIPLAGCWMDGIDGNGDIVEVEKRVESFHAVSLSDGLPAEIVPGEKRVVLRLDANIVDMVRVEVQDGVLRIEAKDPSVGFNPSDGAVIQISSPTIDRVMLSDGSTAHATTNGESVAIEIFDGATIEVTTEGALTVELTSEDGSSAKLGGEGDEVHIVSSDGSEVDSRIPARAVTVASSDGSEVSAHASEYALVEASDGSEVRIHGNPADRDVDASDGSSVDFVD